MILSLFVGITFGGFLAVHASLAGENDRRLTIPIQTIPNNNGSPYSFYWKEVIDRRIFKDWQKDKRPGALTTNKRKPKRQSRFHIRRIKPTVLEGNEDIGIQNDNVEKQKDHPLRTDVWSMDVKWFWFAPQTKPLSSRRGWNSRKQLDVELHPEGYCRIVENLPPSSCSAHQDSLKEGAVLGLGRWKKRPWGVTMVIRPLVMSTKQPSDPTWSSFIDDDTEYVFHARGFHWNGFGTSPKLTQGTILLQKQTKKDPCKSWWKSTTSANSSILPVWKEEIELNSGNDDGLVVNMNEFGSAFSNLFRFSSVRNVFVKNHSEWLCKCPHQRWFRPVVGTFRAKGII